VAHGTGGTAGCSLTEVLVLVALVVFGAAAQTIVITV